MTQSTIKQLAEYVEDGPLVARLEREPDNRHDPHAIKVIVTDERLPQKMLGSQGLWLGYIRRNLAAVVAQGMDKGRITNPYVEIQSVDVEHGQAKAFVRLKQRPKVRKATPARRARKTAGKRST
jgi:hypothetical protein